MKNVLGFGFNTQAMKATRYTLAALTFAGGVLATTPAHAFQHFTDLYMMQDGELYRTNEGTGVPQQVGAANTWVGATSLVNGGVATAYAIQANVVWKISLAHDNTEGSFEVISNLDWSGPTKLAQGGYPTGTFSFVDLLIGWQNNHLYRINLANNVTTQLGTEAWVGVAAMTYLNHNNNSDGNDLFVVQANSLWRTNVDTGAYTRLGAAGDWINTVAMTHDASSLYIAQNNHLWRTSPSNGSYVDLGGDWNAVTAMTHLNGTLYVINAGDLYSVNPSNGSFTLLGEPDDWTGVTLMTFRDIVVPG